MHTISDLVLRQWWSSPSTEGQGLDYQPASWPGNRPCFIVTLSFKVFDKEIVFSTLTYGSSIPGTKSFPGHHDSEAIRTKLLEMRLDFGLLPKVPDVHSLSPEELRRNLPGAFEDEPVFERPALTTDGGANMGKSAEGGGALFDWHPCVCHLLNTAVTDALKKVDSVVAPVQAFSKHVRKSPSVWAELQRLQRVFLNGNRKRLRVEGTEHSEHSAHSEHSVDSADSEHSDDDIPSEVLGESEDDLGYLSDEMIRNTNGTPLPTRVLRISALCPTRWNSTYFLIQRVLLLEQSIRRYMQAKSAELKRAEDKAKEKGKPPPDSSYLFDRNTWLCLRQLMAVLEPIREVSERLEGDTYVTISDVLYFLLKLLYDKLDEVDESSLGCDVASVVAISVKKKLLLDIDDVNKIYSWGLAAALDGRRQHLTWMRKIWENKEDWPNLVAAYPTYMDFRKMLVEEVGSLVRSTVCSTFRDVL